MCDLNASSYRRWPGWMLFYPFRLRLPDLTPTSCGRGQENSSSTEQHPARQKQGSNQRSRSRSKPTAVPHRTHDRGKCKQDPEVTAVPNERGNSLAPRYWSNQATVTDRVVVLLLTHCPIVPAARGRSRTPLPLACDERPAPVDGDDQATFTQDPVSAPDGVVGDAVERRKLTFGWQPGARLKLTRCDTCRKVVGDLHVHQLRAIEVDSRHIVVGHVDQGRARLTWDYSHQACPCYAELGSFG